MFQSRLRIHHRIDWRNHWRCCDHSRHISCHIYSHFFWLLDTNVSQFCICLSSYVFSMMLDIWNPSYKTGNYMVFLMNKVSFQYILLWYNFENMAVSIPVVCEILCCFSSSFVLNLELHFGHGKGLYPVCISSCFLKDGFVLKALGQNLHFSGCSSRCINIWRWKLKACLNALLLQRLR